MKITYDYLNYHVNHHLIGNIWSARILPPGTNLLLGAIPTATKEEGEQVLLKRVREAIDIYIAKTKAVLKPKKSN